MVDTITIAGLCDLNAFYDDIRMENLLVFDTETLGLNSYKGEFPFLLQAYFPNISRMYVLNLFESVGCPWSVDKHADDDGILSTLFRSFESFFASPSNVILGHNIKFDLHMMYNYFLKYGFDLFPHKESSDLKCSVCDTMSLARVVKNDLVSYSLQNLSEY